MAKVSLKCSSCGGVLDADEGRNVLFCPYCGSKELLLESDAVKIEKIRNQAYTTVETSRYATESEMQARKIAFEEKKQAAKDERKKTLTIVVALVILFLLSKFMFGF